MSVPRELTRARQQLKQIRTLANELLKASERDSSIDVLEDLMRRGEHVVADGYPTSSLGGGVSGGGAESSTSTERAALRLASPAVDEGEKGEPDEWTEQRDLVSDALRELVLNIDLAATTMRDNDDVRRLILSVHERVAKRQADLGDCEGCGRTVLKNAEDPMVSGYCPECFAAWEAKHRPERIEFNRTRALCAECNRSTDDWEVLDKRNYHRRGTGPGCYWKAYNRTRGARRGA